MRRLFSGFRLRQFPAALAVLSLLFAFAGAAFALTGDDTPIVKAGLSPKEGDESAEQRFLLLDESTTAASLQTRPRSRRAPCLPGSTRSAPPAGRGRRR